MNKFLMRAKYWEDSSLKSHHSCLEISLHILTVAHQALINILFNYLCTEALRNKNNFLKWQMKNLFWSQHDTEPAWQNGKSVSYHCALMCPRSYTTDLQGELKVWDVFHIEMKCSIFRRAVRISWKLHFFLTTSITSNLIIPIQWLRHLAIQNKNSIF